MAQFIPLDSTVYLLRASTEVDEWGIPKAITERVTIKARTDFNGQSRLVKTQEGKEVQFTCNVFLKGAVRIGYTDSVEYYNPIFGWVVEQPKNITPMNDMAGKTMYTRITL